MDLQFVSRIHFYITVTLSNSLGFHYLFHKFSIFLTNSQWIYLVFGDSQWIYHLFRYLLSNREFTMNSLSSREVILNSVSVPRIHYYCRLYTIYSSSISQSHYEFISPESTFSRPNYKFAFSFTNSLSISRIHYQYAINFSNSIWIQFQFREFAIYLVRIPWIHYLFLSYTINSLSISLIK